MGVTGSCDETIFWSLTDTEPDYERPVTGEELLQALEARTRTLRDEERVEADLQGDDAFEL